MARAGGQVLTAADLGQMLAQELEAADDVPSDLWELLDEAAAGHGSPPARGVRLALRRLVRRLRDERWVVPRLKPRRKSLPNEATSDEPVDHDPRHGDETESGR